MSCNCPSCKAAGKSVASLIGNGTSITETEGSSSGVGVALGTFGVGVGVGSGSYSEVSQSQSLIVKQFASFVPVKAEASDSAFGDVAMHGLMIAFVIVTTSWLWNGAAWMGDQLPHNKPESVFPSLQWFLGIAWYALPALGVLWLFYQSLSGIGDAKKKYALACAGARKYNLEVLPLKIKKYNSLRYCEQCNLVFDEQGNADRPTKEGFEAILNKL